MAGATGNMEGSTAVESQLESTLYPKITNHIGEIIKTLQWLHRDPETPEKEIILDPIPIVGTVKLHGTHADLLIHNDDTILLQSRNKTNLLVTADNAGFAAAMANKKQAIIRLRDQYVARYAQLNPDVALDTALPIIIAGEWIGEKIQKGVAISQLSKRLVIISAKINGEWIGDTEYSDIESPENDIYNIARGGIYHATLYPQEPQRTADDLEPLAEDIAQKCPFAEKFGIKGHGEGLVWKLAPAKYNSNPILWFKTKGGAFKPGIAPPPKKPAEGTSEKREAAAAVAKIWCSEQRLEQGGDYLREQNMAHVMNNFSTFLKWIQRDILVEEKGYIVEHGIDKGMLMGEVVKIARVWYESRI